VPNHSTSNAKKEHLGLKGNDSKEKNPLKLLFHFIKSASAKPKAAQSVVKIDIFTSF